MEGSVLRGRCTMDPALNTQGADPIPSLGCVDAKRPRCLATPDDTVFIVLYDNNTSSRPAPVHPLDDENLLEEILLRLPPKPSSLPRASLVCMPWRSILSDTQFLSRYRKHHRKPPLLGFFAESNSAKYDFVFVLDTKPNRIPAERFAVPKSSIRYDKWYFLDCRHGLVVLIDECVHEVVVWDPLTGQQHRVPFPPMLRNAKKGIVWVWHAAVLCVDPDDGHVRGDCFSSPFKLVLMCGGQTEAFACLYEPASGVWGNIVSMVTTDLINPVRPSVLIGNTLFWLLRGGGVLAFDVERQTLDVIEKPVDAHVTGCLSLQLLRTNDSGLGFAVMSKLGIQLWKRSINSHGIVGWVLQPKVIQLEGLFPRGMRSKHKGAAMMGYDEESNVIVLGTYIGDFMLQLESIQFERISFRNCWNNKMHYPYRNFYTAVIYITTC
ncbi:unnamed protein product [Alopecurus aequalis]